MSYRYTDSAPPAQDFIDLREKCGWGRISVEIANKSLSASLSNVTAFSGDQVVGFVRVVGDGALYFYIQDLVVDENHRGNGIGKTLMNNIMDQLRSTAPEGSMIALMSASGKEPFYESFGFFSRPIGSFGAGMMYKPTN
ncbi:MAG: GNAT family N-acetyltransferase [Hyphomonas sp.]